MSSLGSQRRAGSCIHSVKSRLQNIPIGMAGDSKTRLPSIRSHSTSPTGKASYNPGCPWDRFTKLKGSLVNGILSKYNKQGGQSSNMRPDLVRCPASRYHYMHKFPCRPRFHPLPNPRALSVCRTNANHENAIISPGLLQYSSYPTFPPVKTPLQSCAARFPQTPAT